MKRALLGSKARFFASGETEIRTRDTLLEYTRFPGVPLKPLEHLSNVTSREKRDCKDKNFLIIRKIYAKNS